MYERIKDHPPVRKIYADTLAAEGVVSEQDAEAMAAEAYQEVADAHTELKESLGGRPTRASTSSTAR